VSKPGWSASWLLLLTLAQLLFAPAGQAADEAPSAAALDWVEASKLSAEDAILLPWCCTGRYIEPPAGGDPLDTEVRASAISALHRSNLSSTLEGDVVITRGDTTISSPFVTIDAGSDIATIQGPLVIRRPGFLLTGASATSNIFDGTGNVEQATFLLHEAGLRGSAGQLRQDPDRLIRIEDGAMTRCEPDSNTWMLRGQDFVLDNDAGYGVARNVTLAVKDIPVMYLPWIRFPLNDSRQSGLLLPSLSSDGTGGTDIALPYYFNIAPNLDATYQLRSLWRRGLGHEGQLRYLTPSSINEVNAGYLPGDDIFDARTLTNPVATTPFVAQDRWYLDLRHRSNQASRWQTSVNYSAVSDIDYLQDFGGNIGATSGDEVATPIDQNLANQRSAALERLGQVSYRGDTWRALLSARDYQPLDPNDIEQYAVLPKLVLNHARHFGRLQVASRFEYAQYDKNKSAGITNPRLLDITGGRGIAGLNLTYAYRQPWGFIKPALSLLHRQYQLDNTPAGLDQAPQLNNTTFSLDTGLVFDRPLQWAEHDFNQTLEPRLFYVYTPEKNQDNLPLFDVSPTTPGFAQLFRTNRFNGADRIADANQLSVAVTSRVFAASSGRQLLAASIGQIQYFKDRKVLLNPTSAVDYSAASSPFFTEAVVTISDELRFRAGLEWDAQESRTERRQFSLNYSSEGRRILNLGYAYTNPEVESRGELAQEESNVSIIWPIHGQWSGIGVWNFDWDKNQTLETLVGVEYNDCCWKSRLVFRRFLRSNRELGAQATGSTTVATMPLIADRGIYFEFQFKGLATLGRGLDAVLESAIPGYRAREDSIGR
jgi:LPS-assembly protein